MSLANTTAERETAVQRENTLDSAQRELYNITSTTTDSDPPPSIYPRQQQQPQQQPQQQQQHSSEQENCFDALTPTVKKLGDTMREIESQFHQLKKVNHYLHEFNKSFSAFLFGMAINDTTVTWTKAPTKEAIEEHKKSLKKLREAETSDTTIPTQQQAGISSSAVPTHSPRNENNATAPSNSNSNSNNSISRKRKLIPSSSANANTAKRRPIKRINIKGIISRLPLAYQEKTEKRTNMENVLKVLELFPKGL
ncbi:hypothetical protein BDF20DRAFT_653366 [Mycotypha africana]|uniref:uncharacterized protein n=1 Tax=Mycotypha africana TaxID=64632 RepID=UPI0023008E2B|nr:uncharacterized protein BDF20DRAFT_653366 [Mycotypha africana]KAI8973456.1 hypothetical protein BDF20DRAFT_653366 [Mycotypha africana]